MNPQGLLSHVLLQRQSSQEVRTVLTACLVSDLQVLRDDISSMPRYAAMLRSGACLPVGSVEFVAAAMTAAGVQPPVADPYPPQLAPWLHRAVTQTTTAEALASVEPVFIKPVALKTFDGFVFEPDTGRLSEHAEDQLRVLRALPPNTPVWRSEPVVFRGEWRYYVQQMRVAGMARYDYGADLLDEPQMSEVLKAIEAFGRVSPYAIDMGVLPDGRTALVEVNDAWAIGYYTGCMSAQAYLAYLARRWGDVLRENSNP